MFIIIVSLMIFMDRLSKLWAIRNLKGHSVIQVWDDFFELSYVENSGAAFGMLKNARWFFLIFTVLVLIGILYYYRKNRFDLNKTRTILLAFFVGGTIGNLIDRWQWGYVVDFFSVRIGTYSFPVFNIADIGITVSVFAYIFILLIEERKRKDV